MTTLLQPRAQRIVNMIEDAFSQCMVSPHDDFEFRSEVQGMIWDLGGRNLPMGCSLAAATQYLLMLWLARGAP